MYQILQRLRTIRIEITSHDGDDSIFDGTTEVVATVHYLTCLQGFYADKPEFMQGGAEGGSVFATWSDRLCTSFEGTADCVVEQIDQAWMPDFDVFTLKVTYAIEDPASIANQELHVGPLPTSELAGCQARIELQQSGLVGRNGGAIIWRISTLPANNNATTDQGVPLRIEAIALP